MAARTSPVVVLDGGLSNALADRGHDLTDELWTARLLRDAPGEIAAVHRTYFEAGAQVATTVSTRNVDFARSLGADEVIDYTQSRFEDALQKVDVVIDLVGNVADDTGTRSLDVLKHGGLYLNVPTGSWPEYAAAAAERGLRSSSVKVESDGSNLGIIGRLIDAGDVHVEVAGPDPAMGDPCHLRHGRLHRCLHGGNLLRS